jgi:hypothetical protein
MKKFIFTLLVLSLFLVASITIAKGVKSSKDDLDYAIPEQEGTYDVPGHPELKVRIFVYKPKVKPAPGASPVLVCNLTDPNSTAVVDPTGWKLPTGQWTYRLNTSSVPSSVGSGNLSTIAQLAFGTWSNTINGKVNFVAGPSITTTRAKYDGQNIVTWGKASGSALAVTYIWYYPSTGLVAEVDTIMNTKFPWSWTNQAVSPNCADANSYDAQDILTHELGHWMGLDDEYTGAYVNNTMYGYGSKQEVKKDTLTTGDINSVTGIY